MEPIFKIPRIIAVKVCVKLDGGARLKFNILNVNVKSMVKVSAVTKDSSIESIWKENDIFGMQFDNFLHIWSGNAKNTGN